MPNPLIGILGGMGPQAGLDLASKIIAETRADLDQQHVPVVLFSLPRDIPNRTEFLGGRTDINPGVEIARQLIVMQSLGVTAATIACNTAHADPIFEEIQRRHNEANSTTRLLHLVDETVRFINVHSPDIRRIGILATEGTYQFRIYENRLVAAGLEPILPDPKNERTLLQAAIFNPTWGIKAQSNPVSDEAQRLVRDAIHHLQDKGAEKVILGCTELVLAMSNHASGKIAGDVHVIDPARIMARALISHVDPDRLRPLDRAES